MCVKSPHQRNNWFLFKVCVCVVVMLSAEMYLEYENLTICVCKFCLPFVLYSLLGCFYTHIQRWVREWSHTCVNWHVAELEVGYFAIDSKLHWLEQNQKKTNCMNEKSACVFWWLDWWFTIRCMVHSYIFQQNLFYKFRRRKKSHHIHNLLEILVFKIYRCDGWIISFWAHGSYLQHFYILPCIFELMFVTFYIKWYKMLLFSMWNQNSFKRSFVHNDKTFYRTNNQTCEYLDRKSHRITLYVHVHWHNAFINKYCIFIIFTFIIVNVHTKLLFYHISTQY